MRLLSISLFLVILVCGAIDAGFGRTNYQSDGISYLDMAHAVRAHQWRLAISPYWGLGYPLLYAFFQRFFTANATGEWFSTNLTSFFIFCAALASYLFLCRQLKAVIEQRPSRVWGTTHWTLGLTIFLALELTWDRPSRCTPDLLISCIDFFVSALLIRLAMHFRPGTAFLLGLAGGAGYVTKAIYLPFSLACILLSLPCLIPGRRKFPAMGLAMLGFATLAVPYIAAMSWSQQTFITGESGPLNYAWVVNRLKFPANWQGGPAGYGQPLHPSHQALAEPHVYTYAETLPVTYPPWFNPYYFYRGYRHFFSAPRQLRALRNNISLLIHLLLAHPFFYAVPGCALLIFIWRRDTMVRQGEWKVLIWIAVPALLTCGLYLLVDIESRYIAGFVAIFLLLGVMNVSTAERFAGKRLAALVAILLAAAVLDVALSEHPALQRIVHRESFENDFQWKAANALAAAGVRPGDEAGVILIMNPGFATWAHITGVHIIGETEAKEYWAATPETQRDVLNIYRKAGATLVFGDMFSNMTTPQGWTNVPGTNLIYRKLASQQAEVLP